MRKLNKVIAVFLAAGMILSFAACGKSPTSAVTSAAATPAPTSQPVKIRIYTGYNTADPQTAGCYDTAIADLKVAMPNVEIELDIQATDDGQKIRTYAATGNMPDIINVTNADIGVLSASKNILVLDDYVKDFAAKMYPGAKHILYAKDGHSYEFPYAGDYVAMLFYNKSLFESNGISVPTKFSELLSAVKTFKDKGIIPISVWGQQKWPGVLIYDMFATKADPQGTLKLDSGEARASNPGYLQAAERFSQLVSAGAFPKGVTNMSYEQASALFYEEKAAMFVNGSWEIPGSTDKLKDKVDWMYYPMGDDGSTIHNWAGGSAAAGFAVAPGTKDIATTVKVAQFFAESYCKTQYVKFGNPISSLDLAGWTPEKPIPAMFEKWLKEAKVAKSFTLFSTAFSNPDARAVIEDNCQSMLVPGFTAKQFAENIDKKLDEIYKK